MVQVDITSGLTGAINGASSAAKGVVLGTQIQREEQERAFRRKLARDNFDLLQLHQQSQQKLAETEAEQRRVELERLNSERMGSMQALEDYGGIMGRQFKPGSSPYSDGGESSFFGDPSKRDDDPMGQFEKVKQEQAQHFIQNAPPDPNARRAYMREFFPLLQNDWQDEETGIATKQMADFGDEAVNSGLLDPEMQATVEGGLQGLKAGAVPPHEFMAMLTHAQETTARKMERQLNQQAGATIFQNEVGKVMQGGGDPAPLHKAYAKWLTDQKGGYDPKKLDVMLQEARLGTSVRKIKVGDVEIPHDADVESVFMPVALAQATKAARAELSHDPEIASLLAKAKGKDGEWTPAMQRLYDVKLEKAKRAYLYQYAAQARLDPRAIDFLFPPEQAPKPSDDEIRAQLKAAGIDPDRQVTGSAGPPAERDTNTSLAHDSGTGAFAPQRTANDVNADGVVNEDDLKEIYK
jgi:hypothetical protein